MVPATSQTSITKSNEGLTATAHVGDAAVLLAFDLEKTKTDHLAGFAIHCSFAGNADIRPSEFFLKNRLSFEGTPAAGPDDESRFHPSNEAPFQLFHWVHVPAMGMGKY